MLLVFSFGLSACVSKPAATRDNLRFIVIGDWGDGGSAEQYSVAAAMTSVAERQRIDFIATVGDNIYPKGVASIDDPLFERAWEFVYQHGALQDIPWWLSLGNHDYQGNIQAQIDYGAEHANWNMPATYYSRTVSVDHGTDALFVFADSNALIESYRGRPEKYLRILEQDPVEQTAWLEQTLCESEAEWKFVVAHHPLESWGHHGDSSEIQREWQPIFERCGVSVYFSGHEHHMEYRVLSSGLIQVISGAGAKLRELVESSESPFVRSTLGFAVVEVRADTSRIVLLAHTGDVMFDSGSITRAPTAD